MSYYFKPMLFFCLVIQASIQYTNASSHSNLNHEEHEAVSIKTIPLHFSHTKSPLIREMGYCQISIYDKNTDIFHAFPPLNVHTRSPNTSPREKEANSPTEKRKISRRYLPPPQTYEQTYDIPYDFLKPKHHFCISFFVESVCIGYHERKFSFTSWQGLENIPLFDLGQFSDHKSGRELSSIEVTIDWNKEPPPSDFDSMNLGWCPLHDLETATTFTTHYR